MHPLHTLARNISRLTVSNSNVTPLCHRCVSTTVVTKGKGGGRFRRAEEELDMPLVSKVKHEPKIVLTVEQVENLLQRRQARLRPTEGFNKNKPVDDVYLIADYSPKYWSFKDCIENHRQACVPEIFNNPGGVVTATLLLCMRTKKKTKFTTEHTGTLILPHAFDTGKPKRKILAVSGSEDDLEIARKYNAELSGGKQILSQLSNDELVLEEDGIEIVICTADLLTELLSIKTKLPVFPTKKAYTTGYDMESMMNTHTNGIYYQSKKWELRNPLTHTLTVPIGRLDMPIEELEANWKCWADEFESKRNIPSLSSVILEATVHCTPSPEEFKLDLGLSGEEEEAELSDDEEEPKAEDEDSDDEEPTKKKASKKR